MGTKKPAPGAGFRELLGAEGQNRTGDTMIFSHVLYRLSYLGTRLSIIAAWHGICNFRAASGYSAELSVSSSNLL